MIYSVFNPRRGVYDYYEGLGGSDVDTPEPTHLRGFGNQSVVPEQASWRVPLGAKRIGSGFVAKGMVATLPSGLGGSDFETSVSKGWLAAGLGLAAYLLWKTGRARR